jgi:lipoprotein-releasing system permease protein
MYRYFLALRYLLSRPINVLGVVGILLGVWALIVVVSIFSGYLREVKRHLQSSTADMTAILLPEDVGFARLAEVVNADPNVVACAPRIVWSGLIHPFGPDAGAPLPLGAGSFGEGTPLVSVIGVDPASELSVTGLRDWTAAVDDPAVRVDSLDAPFTTETDHPGLLMSRRRIAAERVSKGTPVRVTTGRMVRRLGRDVLDFEDREFTLAGAFTTSYAGFDSMNVFVGIDAMRRMLGRDGTDFVNEIAIRLRDASSADATAKRLERVLNSDVRQEYGRIAVRTWAQANSGQLSSIDHQRSLMTLVLFVIMVVAAFLMFATLSMMVTEKTHDIGILTAMGATPSGVMTVFLACGVAIATIGAALGVVAGCTTSIYLDPFNEWLRASFGIDLFPTRIYNLTRVPFDLDPRWIVQVSGMAIVVGLVVSGLPAWRAARHDPVRSLRNE